MSAENLREDKQRHKVIANSRKNAKPKYTLLDNSPCLRTYSFFLKKHGFPVFKNASISKFIW